MELVIELLNREKEFLNEIKNYRELDNTDLKLISEIEKNININIF